MRARPQRLEIGGAHRAPLAFGDEEIVLRGERDDVDFVGGASVPPAAHAERADGRVRPGGVLPADSLERFAHVAVEPRGHDPIEELRRLDEADAPRANERRDDGVPESDMRIGDAIERALAAASVGHGDRHDALDDAHISSSHRSGRDRAPPVLPTRLVIPPHVRSPFATASTME